MCRRASNLTTSRLSRDDALWITGMLDRHGEDFAAMARDPKNAFQLTENQIRRKVVRFLSSPEHFASHAKKRGILDAEEGGEEEEAKS